MIQRLIAPLLPAARRAAPYAVGFGALAAVTNDEPLMGALRWIADTLFRLSENQNREYVVLIAVLLLVSALLYRSSSRQMQAMIDRVSRLEKDLADCNGRHAEVDQRIAEEKQRADREATNLKISLSALWAYLIAAGDRRLEHMDLDDLLAGRVVLGIQRSDAEAAKRSSPSLIPQPPPEAST